MGGMLLPLLGTEGDEGGRLEQQLVHFKQFASQPVEVAVQVYFPFLGCARFPQLALLAGVDAEAAVESHFERTEEVAELFLRTGDAQCQVGVVNNDGVAVYLVRRGDFFVMGRLTEDVFVFAAILSQRGDQGVDFGSSHAATYFAGSGKALYEPALTGGG